MEEEEGREDMKGEGNMIQLEEKMEMIDLGNKAPDTSIASLLFANKNPNQRISNEVFLNKEENSNINSDTNKKDKEYIVSIPCTKIQKGILNDTDVKIQLRNPQITQRSIFDSKFINYDLVTEKFNWVVQRRYSDFVWLRDCIRMLYPADLVPLLPKKQIGNKRFEDAFVLKRMKSLERFLNDLLKNENFKSSTPLIVFIQTTDRSYFQSLMGNMIPAPFPNIEDLMTLNGRLEVLDFENPNYQFKPDYYSNINNYFTLQNETIKRLNDNINNYHSNIQAACLNLNDIKDNFHSLFLINQQATISEKITKVNEEYETFFKNFIWIQSNQTVVFNETIKKFYKEISRITLPFCEVLSQQEEKQVQYESMKQVLNGKKEFLWCKKEVHQWGITKDFDKIDKTVLSDKQYAFSKMLTEETEQLKTSAKLLGYYYKTNNDQFDKLRAEFNDRFIGNIKEFTEKIGKTFSDGLNVYTNLASNIDYK